MKSKEVKYTEAGGEEGAGRVVSRQELRKIGAVIRENRVTVVVDE